MLIDNYRKKELLELPEPLNQTDLSLEALRALASLQRVVLQGTELLFADQPFLKQLYPTQDQTVASKHYVLQTAGSLGAASDDPFYQAIARAADENGLALREVEVDDQGVRGMTAKLDRTWYLLGDEQFMAENGYEIGLGVQTVVRQQESSGLQLLYLAQKQPKRLLGLLAIEQNLNSLSQECIKRLDKQDIEIVLLTARKTRTAKGVANRLGLRLVHSELNNDEKKMINQSLIDPVITTVFVGTAEQLKLVPDEACKVLIGTAEGELPNKCLALPSLALLPELKGLAQKVLKAIKQRFFWCRI